MTHHPVLADDGETFCECDELLTHHRPSDSWTDNNASTTTQAQVQGKGRVRRQSGTT